MMVLTGLGLVSIYFAGEIKANSFFSVSRFAHA